VSKESNTGSSHNKHNGPIIKSGVLPEEFTLPSPARSIPSRKSKKEKVVVNDVLDDFLGVRVENPIAAPSSFHQQK
jgi:hypothetical protein